MPRHTDDQASLSAVAPRETAAALKALAQRNGRTSSQELRMAVDHWLETHANGSGYMQLGDADNGIRLSPGKISFFRAGVEVSADALPGCRIVFAKGSVRTTGIRVLDENDTWLPDVQRMEVIFDAEHDVPLVVLRRYALEAGERDLTFIPKIDLATGEAIIYPDYRYLQKIRVEHD